MSTNTQATANNPTLKTASEAKIRQMFLETVTEEDVRVLTRQLVDMGKEGDFRAIKFIMSYLLCKPGQMWEADKSKRPNSPKSQPAGDAKKWDAGLPPISAAELKAGRIQTPDGGYGDASNISVANLANPTKSQQKRRK